MDDADIIEYNEKDSGFIGTTVNGNKIFCIAIKVKNGKSLSNSQINYYASLISRERAEEGFSGSCYVSASYAIGWRTGRATAIGATSEAYDPAKFSQYKDRDIDFEEKATEFIVYFLDGLLVADGSGGIDLNNDCFFDVLNKLSGGSLPSKIKTAAKLKKRLGISRGAKIHIEHIPKIESMLQNTSINVIGHAEYISELTDTLYKYTIRLIGQHYCINFKQNLEATTQISFIPKTIKEIRTYCLGDVITIYDGRDYTELTIEDFNITKKTFKYLFIKATKAEKLKETFKEYVKNQADILKVSDNKINIFKYPTYSLAAMDIWKQKTGIKEPKAIGDIEGDFLSKAFMGGIRYAERGYEGPYYQFDINSFYPYYMIHKDFQVAFEEGKYERLHEFKQVPIKKGSSELKNYYKYGMYRCTIEKSADENINKLFKYNSKNYYSHYDLKLAEMLNLNISLFPGINAYVYEKESLQKGEAMFGTFIKELYEYKKTCKPIKNIINSLWGTLCQRKTYKEYHNIFKTADIELEHIHEFNVDRKLLYIKYTKKEEAPFLTSHARVGMILTSFARYKFIEQVLKHKDIIIKIHTDSIMTTEDLSEQLNISKEMGAFKLEHHGTCVIVNGNKTIYEKDEIYKKAK